MITYNDITIPIVEATLVNEETSIPYVHIVIGNGYKAPSFFRNTI